MRSPSTALPFLLATLTLVLSLLVSCTSTVHPPGAARDGSHQIVRSIRFVGSKNIDTSEIVDGLAMRPPLGRFFVERTYFDPLTHRLDVKRIEAYYQTHGYLSAKVVKAEARLSGKARKLVYHVEQGPLTEVRELSVELPEQLGLSGSELERHTPLKGTAFSYLNYELAMAELVKAVVAQGYPFAQVTGAIEVQPDRESAHIRYQVAPGPAATFGALTIVGNRRIPKSKILSRVVFQEGDAFSWKLLEKTRTELYAMGVFASVEFEVQQGEQRATPLTLRLKEAARYELKLGAGAGIDRLNYEARARTSYRISSFALPLGQLKFEATPRLSFLRGITAAPVPGFEASSEYKLPDLLSSRVDLTTKTSYNVDHFTGYSIKGPKLSLGLTRGFLDKRLLLSLSWHIRYQFLFSVDDRLSNEEHVLVGLVEPYRLATLVQSLSYDTRDSQLSPTRGWYLSLNLEESNSSLGSQYSYIRASSEARVYSSLGHRTILAGRVKLASALLLGGALPITQRYFAGGASSQRGFSQRALSPTLGGGEVPVGGEALFESNAEVRQKIGWHDVSLVLFVDGAEASFEYQDLFSKGLHWATGMGFRLGTPVGTFRADFGYRLNRKGDDEPEPDSSWNWFLNLGEAF